MQIYINCPVLYILIHVGNDVYFYINIHGSPINLVRYDTIAESVTRTRKLSIQLNLAHVVLQPSKFVPHYKTLQSSYVPHNVDPQSHKL